MKKIITLFTSVLVGVLAVYSVQKFNLVKLDKSVVSYNVSTMDSITFSSDNAYLSIFRSGITAESYLVSEIDSIYFSGSPDTVYITFSGSSATIENPLENQGVSVSVSGADVVVYSTVADNEVRYLLKGTSTDGSVKFYGNYKSEIILSGLTLTNPTGPAINNQSKKRTTVTLAAGTTNSLTDGSTYDSSAEDQKGTFFSEGQLIFTGTGNLSVKGNKGHAICSDDYIEIEGGVIAVSGAVKDGIHSKDHFNLENGTVLISATGDAVECEAGKIKVEGGSLTSTISSSDAKGLKCDSTLTVSGGTINLTVTGNQAKGLKSGGIMSLSGGTIVVNASGAAVTTASGSGYEVSYCTAIKCDTTINISGSNITTTATGTGGKGISSDADINISGGIINITNSGNGATYTNSLAVLDAYSGSGIEADGNINISAGNVTVTSSGTGAKGISADGASTFGTTSSSPIVKVTNTGTRILLSGTANYANANYVKPKAIKSDGMLTVNNGEFTISTNQQDGVGLDSDSILTVNNGNLTVTASGNASKGINAEGTLNINGGTITVNTSGATVLETSGSGYDPSYCSAIKSSYHINLNGGNIIITGSGTGNKGISADGNISVQNTTINITGTGAGATFKDASNTTDSYFCTALKADKDINIQTGNITINETGAASKGISAAGTLTVGSTANSSVINIVTSGGGILLSSSGKDADYSIAKGMKGTTAFVINNGDITIQSNGSTGNAGGGEALESFALTLSGGTINLNAFDDCISVTNGGETMSGSDGSSLIINAGYILANSSVGDAIDSNGTISMTGGTVIVHGPTSSPEEGIDFNGSAKITGGFIMASGSNSNMNQALSTTSTQCNFYILSSSQIASGTLFNIQDASGNSIVTFKPARAYYSIIFSSSSLVKGSTYKIYTGGTCTGTLKDGIYTGGTYSGGTLKKTVTTSTSSTVNKVTF